MKDAAQVSTGWLVRSVIRNSVGIGEQFTAKDIHGLFFGTSKTDVDTVSSTLSDLRTDDKCLTIAGRRGRATVYCKIAEPREVAQRKRRGSVPPPPELRQEAMPLPAPEPGGVTVDGGALAVINAKLLELAEHIRKLQTTSVDNATEAELKAALARIWAKQT